MKLPWVVLRKQYKPYMGETVEAETVSITTGHPQTLHLDEKDRPLVEEEGRRPRRRRDQHREHAGRDA